MSGATAESSAQPATDIKASSRVASELDYQTRLAEWGQQCEKAVEEATEEYMFATIVLIHCDYETRAIEHRLRKIPCS